MHCKTVRFFSYDSRTKKLVGSCTRDCVERAPCAVKMHCSLRRGAVLPAQTAKSIVWPSALSESCRVGRRASIRLGLLRLELALKTSPDRSKCLSFLFEDNEDLFSALKSEDLRREQSVRWRSGRDNWERSPSTALNTLRSGITHRPENMTSNTENLQQRPTQPARWV